MVTLQLAKLPIFYNWSCLQRKQEECLCFKSKQRQESQNIFMFVVFFSKHKTLRNRFKYVYLSKWVIRDIQSKKSNDSSKIHIFHFFFFFCFSKLAPFFSILSMLAKFLFCLWKKWNQIGLWSWELRSQIFPLCVAKARVYARYNMLGLLGIYVAT